MSRAVFTPPRSKSKAHRKQCICDWGEKCCQFEAFFRAEKHDLAGFVDLRFNPNSCDFMNIWRATINLLHVPRTVQNELKEQYNNSKHDPQNHKAPRIKIAKFHFPLEIVQMQQTQWLTPLTKELVEELGCYKNIQPPPHEDGILKYNQQLGKGQSKEIAKRHAGHIQIIKAPVMTSMQVKDIAAEVQNEFSSPRLDLDSRREQHNVVQAMQQITQETQAATERTSDEWAAMMSKADAENCELQADNDFLRAEIAKLLEKLGEREQSSRGATNKYQQRAARVQLSIDREEAKNYRDKGRAEMFDDFMDLLSDAGGLSRLTLFNDDWHHKHPDAARQLFGYPTWTETKLYVQAYFEGEIDVNDDPSKKIIIDKNNSMSLPFLSSFEKCLICRMFIRCFNSQPIHGLIFDRHRTTIGKILKEWAGKWANVGEALACLDITADYIFKEAPDRNIDLGRPEMVYVDGKDCGLSPKRNDSALAKSTFSSKTDKDAARMLTFSTAAGLIFETSRMFAARAGEREIVKHLSSLGPANAPVEDWEDIVTKDPWNPKTDDKFWTAMEDLLKPEEMDEILNNIDLEYSDQRPSVVNGLNDDGVLITAQSSGLQREGITEEDLESDNESTANQDQDDGDSDSKLAGRTIYGINDAFEDYAMMIKCSVAEKELRTTGKRKTSPILSVETLKEQCERAIRSGPNWSGKFKCRQLEIHQRLHLLYESGKLRKCLLSYFLLVSKEDRLKLLSWFGSTLAGDTIKPTKEELPKIPLRLAKIPEHVDIGADKGFTDIDWMLPNLNFTETPFKLENSKTHYKSCEMMMEEIPLTTCRAPTETVFRRVTYEELMNGMLEYWIIAFLPHAHAVG